MSLTALSVAGTSPSAERCDADRARRSTVDGDSSLPPLTPFFDLQPVDGGTLLNSLAPRPPVDSGTELVSVQTVTGVNDDIDAIESASCTAINARFILGRKQMVQNNS